MASSVHKIIPGALEQLVLFWVPVPSPEPYKHPKCWETLPPSALSLIFYIRVPGDRMACFTFENHLGGLSHIWPTSGIIPVCARTWVRSADLSTGMGSCLETDFQALQGPTAGDWQSRFKRWTITWRISNTIVATFQKPPIQSLHQTFRKARQREFSSEPVSKVLPWKVTCKELTRSPCSYRVWFLEHTMQLTTVHNSSSKRSDALFWPLWARGTHMVPGYTPRQNTHTHKFSLKQNKKP